jgi:hypothetical protein
VGVIELVEKRRNLFAAPKPKEDLDRPEWRVQAEAVSFLHKLQDEGYNFEFAGDMNGEIRNGTRAKLTGVKAGETDLRFYFPGAVFKMIELKRPDGRLSNAQKIRHVALRALGFEIEVVFAEVEDVVEKIRPIVMRWIEETKRCLN